MFLSWVLSIIRRRNKLNIRACCWRIFEKEKMRYDDIKCFILKIKSYIVKFTLYLAFLLNFPDSMLNWRWTTVINTIWFHVNQWFDKWFIKCLFNHPNIWLRFHIVIPKHHVKLIYIILFLLKSCFTFKW